MYKRQGKHTEINPEVKALLPKKVKEMDETTIQMRVVIPMINEAANILEEKIVADAATVDLGLIFGIGFPPFRGGLLRYADYEGLDRIKGATQKFAAEVDKDRYALSSYLENLVEKKMKFYSE